MVDLVTYKNEKDPFKIESTREVTTFLPLYVYGDFFRRSRAVTHKSPDRILPNFEHIRDFIGVLVACKNKEDPIKNEGARVVTALYIAFSDAQGQLTPKSVMESCRNSNPIQAFMIDLVTCKNKEDPLENEGTRVVTTFLPL